MPSSHRPTRHLFEPRWWLFLICFAGVIIFALWRPPSSARETSEKTLAPGLTLQKFPYQNTQIYVVRAAKNSAWKLQMGISRGNVMQRETVSQMAAREKAPVAVNGGFFAYDGAALGAVKKEGEWTRLPWKNRTAIGIKNDGTTRIANLQGAAQITINNAVFEAALNGSAPADGFAILTAHYSPTYTVRPGESALEVINNKVTKWVTTGGANIRQSFIIVAKGKATSQIADALGKTISWKVQVTPADWNDYPTILGAGPRLVSNGVARETSREEEFRPDVIERGSRTGVGIAQNGDVLFVIADGETAISPGLTLPELAQLMVKQGAQDALHMDCGPSSVLIIDGNIANRPWTNQPSGLSEPTVPNALFIAQ